MRRSGARAGFIILAGVLASGEPALAAGLEAPAWAIAPEDGACRTDLELVSRSGAVSPVSLVSDGEHVILRFAKEGVAAEAFLPIRIDQRPYSNLVQRTGEEGVALMSLSDETVAALRRGKSLGVAWLGEEAVSGSIAGANQGIADLKTCGAQVAGQRRVHEADLDAQRARQAQEARAKALADEQLAAVRAQRASAEAATRKANAEAEALSAQAEQNRAYAEQVREREQQAERERAYAQQYYYRDRAPAPDPYYSRPYYYPR